MAYSFANNFATTLSGAITNSATSLTLTSATGAPASVPFTLLIGTEIILVGARTTTACSSLTRGAEGTTAASHASGDAVTAIVTAASLDSLVSAGGGGGGGGGALVLLESRTASGSASLDFTTRNATGQSGATFQSDYDEYQIEVVNLIPATDGALVVTVSANNGSTWASANYNYFLWLVFEHGVTGTGCAANTSLFYMGSAEATSAAGVVGTVKLFSPLSALPKLFTVSSQGHDPSGHFASFTGGWSYNNAAVINALQVKFDSGNIASGTVRIYGVAKTSSGGGSGGAANTGLCQGRLTTESGVPVSTSDRTAQSTIYFTPYQGNRVALYSGSAWAEYALTERSLALSGLTSDKNYDVFLYDNAGTLTLELSAAWTNDTTRATALVLQDGVYVKTGATTRRYLGTIRTTSATTTEDSGGGTTTQVGGKRFVWNLSAPVDRYLTVVDKTDFWGYTTGTWRQANGATGNKVEFVLGLDGPVEAHLLAALVVGANNTTVASIGAGVDSVTAVSGLRGAVSDAVVGNVQTTLTAFYGATLPLGYHYLAWLEFGAGVTCNWLGDQGGNNQQSGLTVRLRQ